MKEVRLLVISGINNIRRSIKKGFCNVNNALIWWERQISSFISSFFSSKETKKLQPGAWRIQDDTNEISDINQWASGSAGWGLCERGRDSERLISPVKKEVERMNAWLTGAFHSWERAGEPILLYQLRMMKTYHLLFSGSQVIESQKQLYFTFQ